MPLWHVQALCSLQLRSVVVHACVRLVQHSLRGLPGPGKASVSMRASRSWALVSDVALRTLTVCQVPFACHT